VQSPVQRRVPAQAMKAGCWRVEPFERQAEQFG
jgi:hypothetical protein